MNRELWEVGSVEFGVWSAMCGVFSGVFSGAWGRESGVRSNTGKYIVQVLWYKLVMECFVPDL